MGFSDEQIRNMLELKEDLAEKIIKYKEQIEKLEKNISVLDAILKQSSFTKASDLTRNAPKTIKQERKIAITKIVADGATRVIIENDLKPDIVVTDLDGDIKSLKKAGRTNTVMVVHAHGDNSEKIHLVKNFKNCVGTTQTKPIGKVHNFGGFTDGDRCVFLASNFKAKKIILLGMDFGTRIGKYSKVSVIDRNTKIAKLRRGKKLLEWLVQKSESELYSITKINGFTKIKFQDIDNIITSKNAF